MPFAPTLSQLSAPARPAVVILDGPGLKGVVVVNSDPEVKAHRAAFIKARREEAAANVRPAFDLSADLAAWQAELGFVRPAPEAGGRFVLRAAGEMV